MNQTFKSTKVAISVTGENHLHTQYMFQWVMRCGIIATIILGFIYLLILNSIATQGFALEELKAEQIGIQKELEQAEIAVAIPSSLYALESSEQIQEMAEVEKKTFVMIRNGQVALAR